MVLVQGDKMVQSSSLALETTLSHNRPSEIGQEGGCNDDTPILLRLHSECITSEVFSSVRCDCKEQLRKSMKLIEASKSSHTGIIIYLRQEGRGIGLLDKLR